MRLAVLGATGGIGLEIVRQALERGHEVTAFVRSADRLAAFRSQIVVRQGDLLDRRQLAEAVAGQDAVLSGFGPRLPIAKSDARLLREFADALTAAMPAAGVRRLVIVSTAFLFPDSWAPPAYLIGKLFFPGVVEDAAGMEAVIAASGLEWTIVRPPQLTDKPFTGRYRIREGHLPVLGFKISRADVADAMLRTADLQTSGRKVLGVSN